MVSEVNMAYNFPVGYQPYYQYAQNMNQPQQSSSQLIWVQGEAGAKSYMVAPNQTVTLWDSEQNIIYIKSADASGMPAIKILDYTIRENSTQKTNKAKLQDDFATKEDVSKEIKRLEEMIREIKKPNASSEQAL
jgi:hypothetical protein